MAWPEPQRATQILPATVQDDDHARWLETRRHGLGGSDIAAVLGLNQHRTGYAVWLDKTGQLPPEDQTYLMERGHAFESGCAQMFANRTGLSLRRTGTWRNDDEPWMLANPDRFTSDGAGYEGKIVGADWGDYWQYGPATSAAYQALWCMAVTGLDAWYVAAATERRFRWWRLERGPYASVIDEMVNRASLWWYHHIVCGDPPPVDDSDATSDALKRAFAAPVLAWRCYIDPEPLSHMVDVPGLGDMMAERRRLKTEIGRLERELTGVENRIRAAVGPAMVGLDRGEPVLTQPIATRTAVNADRARDEAPGLFERSNYRTLREIR